MKFVGGFFDGVLLDAKAISRIAGLPSREVLLAKLLGSMMSPVSGLARFFDGAKSALEAKSQKTVKELMVTNVPTPAPTEVKKEAPVAVETKVETPVVPEATVETPASEVVVEVAPEVITEETPTV